MVKVAKAKKSTHSKGKGTKVLRQPGGKISHCRQTSKREPASTVGDWRNWPNLSTVGQETNQDKDGQADKGILYQIWRETSRLGEVEDRLQRQAADILVGGAPRSLYHARDAWGHPTQVGRQEDLAISNFGRWKRFGVGRARPNCQEGKVSVMAIVKTVWNWSDVEADQWHGPNDGIIGHLNLGNVGVRGPRGRRGGRRGMNTHHQRRCR